LPPPCLIRTPQLVTVGVVEPKTPSATYRS
jgi:hypothetical protein